MYPRRHDSKPKFPLTGAALRRPNGFVPTLSHSACPLVRSIYPILFSSLLRRVLGVVVSPAVIFSLILLLVVLLSSIDVVYERVHPLLVSAVTEVPR